MATVDHILIVDDDAETRSLLQAYLQKQGYRVATAADGRGLRKALEVARPDLVVLDLMLPGLSGLEVCRSLRADRATARLPIIMVTARSEETDRILGLDLGADDYLAKPFSPNELVARIRAVMRRSRPNGADEPVLRYGQLTMDVLHHTVADGEREVKLTAKEFVLLEYLLRHRGRVLSRDVLLGDVWGYSYTGGTRTVDVHVRRLRAKLGPENETLIGTVRNVGYRFVLPPKEGTVERRTSDA